MFVVGLRIGVNDQELVVVFADAQRKRQVPQPGRPAFADFVPRPRDLRGLKLRTLLSRGIFGKIAIGVAAYARGADLFEPLQHLLRFRSVEAEIAGRDDRVGAALRFEIRQASVER